MALKYTGTGIFKYGLEIQGQFPLDSRGVVSNASDLTNYKELFVSGGVPTWYVGMEVFAEDTKKKYVLVSEAEGFKPAGADENQLAKLFKYKGTVSKYENLPTENQVIGDVYNVEEAYTETLTVDGTSKTYAAGTNWVWNGTTWDPLAGSVDLSNYVTNETLTSNVNSLSSQISDLNSGLNSANAEIAKKVDAVEGSSLITAEKLALIDTNAGDIAVLKTADATIDARLQVVESMIGDGGEIDLSQLTALVTEQGSKITTLETDNTTNKSNIQSLRTDVNANTAAISAINELNTTQNSRLDALATSTGNNATSITQLIAEDANLSERIDTLSGNLASEISNRETAVNEAKTHAETKATEALNAAKEYANGLSGNYDEAGAAAAVDAKLTAEISRADAAEKANAAAIAAEKARLDLFLADADTTEKAVDTLKEIQAYITTDGAAAEQMLTAIGEAKDAATTAQNEVNALELVVATMDEAYKAANAGILATVQDELAKLGTAAKKDVEYFASAEALANVLEIANAAAPQATTYTKTEVDTQIANAFEWVNVE